MKLKISEFHYEEIVVVLLMLVSNLSGHLVQGLKSFVEAIHRLDTVSKPKFQIRLKWTKPKIHKDFIFRLFELKKTESEPYSSQLHTALAGTSSSFIEINGF